MRQHRNPDDVCPEGASNLRHRVGDYSPALAAQVQVSQQPLAMTFVVKGRIVSPTLFLSQPLTTIHKLI